MNIFMNTSHAREPPSLARRWPRRRSMLLCQQRAHIACMTGRLTTAHTHHSMSPYWQSLSCQRRTSPYSTWTLSHVSISAKPLMSVCRTSPHSTRSLSHVSISTKPLMSPSHVARTQHMSSASLDGRDEEFEALHMVHVDGGLDGIRALNHLCG